MAKMTIKAFDDFEIALSKLGKAGVGIAKKAVYAGAKVIADEVRQELESLPEDTFRHLHGEDQFSGPPSDDKQDLLDALGIADIDVDSKGNVNTRVGFDGYSNRHTSKQYPGGVPIHLLARSVESGSSVRKKTPFVRKAVNGVKQKAISEMESVIEEEINKIMRGD